MLNYRRTKQTKIILDQPNSSTRSIKNQKNRNNVTLRLKNQQDPSGPTLKHRFDYRTLKTTTGNAPRKLQRNKIPQPAKREAQLLPGQTLMHQYLKVIPTPAEYCRKEPIGVNRSSQNQSSNITLDAQTTEAISLPKTQEEETRISSQPSNILQASSQPTKTKLQRTLYDFHFFKPQASITSSDPDIWGHVPETIDTSSIFRVILQNPNGIKPSVTDHNFMFSLHLCNEIGAGAVCLAETNLNWHHKQHYAALSRCMHRNWPASKHQASIPAEAFFGDYQPGGTLTLIVDRWTSRVQSSGMDPYGLGRWSYIVLRGKKDINLCIVTAYRVCKDKYTGPKTAYQQQRRQLSAMFRSQNNVVDPDPNRQFILDLQSWVTHIQQNGMQVILSLDNNEELHPLIGQVVQLNYDANVPTLNHHHNGTLDTLIRSTGLVDILSHHHPSTNYPATYNRGKKRIDIILVSASLLPAVKRSGILPYNSLFHGDHRPCYVDIDTSVAFDGKTPSISPPCQRTLQLKDPRIVNRYVEALSKQLDNHKVSQKVEALAKIEPGKWNAYDQLQYERLDKVITDSMLHAESCAAKKYTKKYEWSPTLLQSVHAERFWKLALRKSQGRSISTTLLERTREAAGIPPNPFSLTLPDIVQCLASARQTRKELQNCHQELRKNYLEKLAEALVLKRAPYLDSDPKYEERLKTRTAKEVKRLLRLEQKRRFYRMIGAQLSDQSENKGGLTRVDVPLHPTDTPLSAIPDPKTWTGPWRSVTDPEEIAQYICVINTRQYNQAQNTPFGSGYLAEQLGFNIEHPAAGQILAGTFQPDPSIALLPETHRIIEYLKQPSITNAPFSTTITAKEFQDTYKIVKERTSSSVSGRHVGHYKAAAQNDSLSQIHAQMMTLPYRIGFSPQRWRRIVDIMLEKEPGNPKLHRLRIIALIESDFNQSQRILIARKLTHRIEDHELVPEMQYGSRPGKLCITPTLNKQLTHDIIRQTKQTAAIIENDAVGCYDRLMNPLLLLAMRRLGVPETMTRSLGQTWSYTSHSIKTQYGVSAATYSNNPETPLFGPSQGSTTGPTLWQLSYILLAAGALTQASLDNDMEEDVDNPVPNLSFQSVDSSDNLDNTGKFLC